MDKLLVILIMFMASSCTNNGSKYNENVSQNKSEMQSLQKYKLSINSTTDEIIQKMEKAKLAEPNNLQIYNSLVSAYIKNNEYDNAIINLKKIIEINKNDISAYNSLGLCYMRNKDGKAAVDAYLVGLALCDKQPSKFDCTVIIQNMATTYLTVKVSDDTNKDMLETIKYAQSGLQLIDRTNIEGYSRFHYLIGEAYLELSGKSNLLQALTHFNEVLKHTGSASYLVSKDRVEEIRQRLKLIGEDNK